MRSKKGLSEIISVTLLIVIVVVLSSLFFAWSRNSATTRMDEISAEQKQANSLECYNAQFYVESCTFNGKTKTVKLNLINNSNIKLFNLNLIINGEVSGSFNKIIDAGETAYLSTDTDFNFNRGNQSTLDSMNLASIENITLTNGACPKEVLDISSCEYETAALSPSVVDNDLINGGTHPWININNLKISDNVYTNTKIGQTLESNPPIYYSSYYIKMSDFGFDIPADAKIDGIMLEIERYYSPPSIVAQDLEIKIIKSDGSIGSTNLAESNWLYSSDSNNYEIYGGENNLWGETWTANNINDSNFGIVLSAKGVAAACLDKDTLILTDNGQIKIKDLEIGDPVLSYNDTTKKLEFNPITNIWSNPISSINNKYYYIYYNDQMIKATENHKFYVNGNYVRADNLKIGDKLLSYDKKEYSIKNIEIVGNFTDDVWDIEIKDNHNFFANNILVHNPGIPGDPLPPALDPIYYYANIDHVRMTVYYTN